jgi:hypothetical protein
MDKSAEMKVAMPWVDKGTESIGFTEYPLERTHRQQARGWGIRGTNVKKKLKNKMVGGMRTNAFA